MALSLRSFTTTVSTAVTAAQGAASSLLDLSVGTPGRAILESASGMGLWLQSVALQILTRNRLSTSEGADVDSFIADFGLTREPGVAATGNILFSSFSPATASATIPVGALVLTISNISYAVVADSTNAAWNNAANGYIRPAGVQSLTLPVQCTQTGTAGNASAGAICLLGTAISGIDTVTNPAAFTNGGDGQTDAAVRAGFVTWLNSLNRATLAAIEGAVEAIATNIMVQGAENADTAGNFLPGNIVLYVDDGSGAVSDALIAQAYAVANEYRASPVSIQVVRPSVSTPTVSMALTLAPNSDASSVQALITAAISGYFNALDIGQGAVYSRLSVLAYGASSSVVSISNLLLNGGTSDIPGQTGVAIRAGSVTYG
ncbi:baseplate J/gp47 family protein [Asaia bogorensis]|uniref:baseplate J/gp47 family protein n=1 Tax=Asaia bogorensis TaxID=91915 RepID=UPI000EFBE585|nr:baseplate J/gp47 family protein [Asaia bogorensis]